MPLDWTIIPPIYISDYGRSMTAGKLREWAAGQFGEDDRLYPSTLSPKDYSDPARLAEDLGCSTDYLLGVTDQLTPAALSTATDLETDRALALVAGATAGERPVLVYHGPHEPRREPVLVER